MAEKNEQGVGNLKNFKIVFLVDVFLKEHSICRQDLEDIRNLKSRAISLCVLRLLLHFNSAIDHASGNFNNTSLKWGFKFYNSNALNFEYKRRRFYELDSQSFEQFEEEMNLRFTDACTQNNSTKVDSKSNKATSAKSLSCCVTEILHDFPWVTPDISSPSRSAKNEVLTDHSKASRNFLFVIGDCPQSGIDVSQFLGRSELNGSVYDADTVLSEIFSMALFEEFRNTYGLSLFWIDSGLWCVAPAKLESSVEDWQGHTMMSSVTKKLGGNMIPISSLVQGNTCPLTLENNSLSPKGFKQKAKTLAELRVMAATFQFSFGKIVEAFLSGKDCISLNVINDVKKKKRNGLLYGNLYFNGWKCCSIVLSYILHKNTSDPSVECNSKNQTPKPGATDDQNIGNMNTENKSSGDNSTVTAAQETRTEPKAKTANELNCSISTDENTQSEEEFWNNNFVIKGVISCAKVSPSWMHPTRLYSCFSGKTSSNGDESTSEQENNPDLYQQLLSLVSSKSLTMVVEYTDPDSGYLVTGLLQPITSLCAVLSMVKNEMLLLVEKVLLRHKSLGYILCEVNSDELVNSRVLPCELRKTGDNCGKNKGTKNAGAFDKSSRNKEGKVNEKKIVNSYICLEKKKSEGRVSVKERRLKLKDYYSRKKTEEECAAQASVLTRGKLCQNASQKIKASTSEETESQMQNIQDSAMESEDSTTISNLDSEQTDAADEELPDMSAIQSVEDLKAALEDDYKRCIEQEQPSTVYVTRVFRFIEHLRLSGELKDNSEIESVLKSTVIRDVTNPREISDGEENEVNKEKIILEYKLQVFLRLEFADKMGVVDEEKIADEITAVLRAISFKKDPGYVRSFLKNNIIPRYAGNLSSLLCQVYDGLMQRPPNEILSPSQVTSEEETPLKSRAPRSSSKKTKSVEDPQSSENSRTLVRRHSVMGIPAKRREIVLPEKGNPTKGRKKVRSAGKKSGKKSSKMKKSVTPVKKVRRNLFIRSAEGDAGKSSPKKPSKNAGSSTSQRGNLTRCHSVAAFTASMVVADTPVAKQVSGRMLREQEWARRRTKTPTDVTIVAESPQKDDAVRPFPRRSPRQKAASFYCFQRPTAATSDTRPATADQPTNKSYTTLTEHTSDEKTNSDEGGINSMTDNRSSRSVYRAKSMTMKPSLDSVVSPRRKITRSLSVSGVSSHRLTKGDSFSEVFLETGDESGDNILSVCTTKDAGQNIVPGKSCVDPNKPQCTSSKPSVKQKASECPSKSSNTSPLKSTPTPGCSTRSVSRRSNSSPSLSITSPSTPSQSRCLLVHHKSFPTTSPVLFGTPKTSPKSSPINFSPEQQIFDIAIPLTPVKSLYIKSKQTDAAKNSKLGTSPFRNCDIVITSSSVVADSANVVRESEGTVRDSCIAEEDLKNVVRDSEGVVRCSDIVAADSESVVAASPQINRKRSLASSAKFFRSKTSLNFETSTTSFDVRTNDVLNQPGESLPVSNGEVGRPGAEIDNQVLTTSANTEQTEVFKSPVERKRKRVASARTGNESPLNQILKQRKRSTPPGTPRGEKLDKEENSKNVSKKENKRKQTSNRKASKGKVNSETDDTEEKEIAEPGDSLMYNSDDTPSPDKNNFTHSPRQQRNPKLTSPRSCSLKPQFTPRSLSADSLRHLQESPVLFGSSPQSSDPSTRTLTRKWSERKSPLSATQHTLRKRLRHDS